MWIDDEVELLLKIALGSYPEFPFAVWCVSLERWILEQYSVHQILVPSHEVVIIKHSEVAYMLLYKYRPQGNNQGFRTHENGNIFKKIYFARSYSNFSTV